MASAKNTTKKLNTSSSDDTYIPSSRNVEGNLWFLKRIYTQYEAFICRSCGAKMHLGSPKEHVRDWIMGAKECEPSQISGFKCRVKNCQTWTCIGCHQKPTLGSKTIPTSVAHVDHCCDKGRLFGIYILLSRFDEIELQLRQDIVKNETKRASTISRAGTGTGYASEDSFSRRKDGFFSRIFAGSRGYDLNWQDVVVESRKENARTEDMVADLMILLTAFLPNPRYESKFDKSPPPELYALLRMSLLMDRVSALVRNDSVIDLGKRANLYNALLDVIAAIGKHPQLVKLLVEERLDKKKSPGVQFLGDVSKQASFISDNSPRRMCASVIATGLPTLKHTDAFLGLSRNTVLAEGFRTINDQDSAAINICRRFRDLYEIVDQTAPIESNQITSKSKNPWTEFNEKNRVDFTDSVLERHCFYAQFCHSQTSTRGRMAAIMKEIASLSTSLPPGIFLKISESRPDVMKVLIAGVDRSTYEGGLFAFDVFLPSDWPVQPPKVYFVLDGHDDKRVGFNPNIHPNGKVCLSLLNTWKARTPAEAWQPNQSTLLSVFVSIQAMILGVSDPFSNEPLPQTYNTGTHSFHALYNQKVEQRVLQYAILYWLVGGSLKKSIWYDLARQFYGGKRKQVLARVRDLGRSNEVVTGFVKDVEKYLDV